MLEPTARVMLMPWSSPVLSVKFTSLLWKALSVSFDYVPTW
jgi:hypothetical protein